MFVGDEYAVFRSVSDELPPPLDVEALVTVPRGIVRIVRTYEILHRGSMPTVWQISSRLRLLSDEVLQSILDSQPEGFSVITGEELRPGVAAVMVEATAMGVPLTPLGSELAGAARLLGAPIWLGPCEVPAPACASSSS